MDIKNMSAEDFKNMSAEDFKNMSKEDIKNMSTEYFKNMSEEDFKNIFPDIYYSELKGKMSVYITEGANIRPLTFGDCIRILKEKIDE